MSPVAFLPMYAVRGADRHAGTLWVCLRDSVRQHGMQAPESVSHFEQRFKGWLHPDMILGQTCGLPYIASLCDSVELIGTPDYGVEGCPPGFYHSTLVASPGDKREHLPEFFGCTLAINGTESQSGYGAIMRASAPYARHGRFFGRAIRTGSHEASMRLIANGLADIAAIDSVTWRMTQLFDPEVAALKVIGTTEPAPGLPFIAAIGRFNPKLFDAVRAGIAALPQDTRQAFGLRDLIPLNRQNYEVIKTNLTQAEAMHTLPEIEDAAAASLG
jgi:ABC-type phosphate/phosphonate transport system substrate-binding protein